MGYFNALSEALFKEDENGNSIFYKWGVFGRGVLIDTQERRDKVILFISTYYAITFVFIFIMQFSILFLHTDFLQTTLFFLGVGVILMVWYYLKIEELTKGLEYSQTKLSIYDGWKKTSYRLPKYVIWGGFIMMLLLVVLAIVTFFLDDFPVWIGLFLLILGVFASYGYYKMIIFSKDIPVPIPPVKTIPEESSEKAMEWNLKNSSIVFSVFIVVAGFVYYVYFDAKQEYV